MYPSAIEAFDHAIVTDPGFALAHASRAHVLLECGGPLISLHARSAIMWLTLEVERVRLSLFGEVIVLFTMVRQRRRQTHFAELSGVLIKFPINLPSSR